MNNKIRIGITEAGDAGIDFSWYNKMKSFDGAILITKCLNDEFIEKAMEYKNKIIVHATCTGWGGSIIEPNVPAFMIQLNQVKKLIEAGFPKDQIVIRVDPIIPTEEGIANVKNVVTHAWDIVQRFRISVIDMYPHVITRFREMGIPLPYENGFQATDEQMKNVDEMLKNLKTWAKEEGKEIVFETCAEPRLHNAEHTGCISDKDLNIFGIDADIAVGSYQRPACLCLGCKTEMLSSKVRCPNHCLYCYWKDN